MEELMTLVELGQRFHISFEQLKAYEALMLLPGSASQNYTDADAKQVSLLHDLENAGMNLKEIKTYIEEHGENERIRTLHKKRCCLLEELHAKQQILDKLDYIIRELKGEVRRSAK
jgi:DNA-binding transcriptional MerR regulator